MDTNYFGPLAVTRALLPLLRERGSGTIVNISSEITLIAAAACGNYSASKHAIEGFTEALACETGALGIRTIMVVPGGFLTMGPESRAYVKTAKAPDAAYDKTPVKASMEMIEAFMGNQPGDPNKAAARMFEVVTSTGMGATLVEKGRAGKVLRVPIGNDVWGLFKAKVQDLNEVLEHGQEIAESTDF